MKLLNVGILAHVDAGKTSLTERLLFDAGVIPRLGRVDGGTTQTDSSDLERRRGITIRSAVASFTAGDLTVNLIDTPGHPDFIAEVERGLRVLDGVVLVISAVEGVQAQTRVLMRTLTRLRIPTLLFVNKIDRAGARELLPDIAAKLTPAAVPMTAVDAPGTRDATVRAPRWDEPGRLTAVAELLARNNDAFLAAYLDDPPRVGPAECRAELAAQCGRALAHPVYLGSAITGAGVGELVGGIRELLPAPRQDGDDEAAFGTVFKIESGPGGEKVAYLRMFSGQVGVRERVVMYRVDGSAHPGKVTGLRAFAAGGAVPVRRAGAGAIVTLSGLSDVRIGDSLGRPDPSPPRAQFAPPTLETAVRPARPSDGPALSAALRELAERDPLIELREDGEEASVRLYGQVQREVLAAQLAEEYGVRTVLSESRTIYQERPVGVGEAFQEIDKRGPNEFFATIGIRVEPGPDGSGVRYRIAVELGSLPAAFHTAIEDSVRATLRRGLHGWEVTDCLVTLTRSGFASPISTGADFRNLAPLLVTDALRRAGTRVYEPVNELELEIPPGTAGPVLGLLAEAGARVRAVEPEAGRVLALVAAARTPHVQRGLPALTHGEGLMVARFDRYRAVSGQPPHRHQHRPG